jgi:hypothetical protein
MEAFMNLSVFNVFDSKKVVRLVYTLFLLFALAPHSTFASDRFTDSDDFKDKNFKKGIFSDYSDLEKGKDIDWVWVKKGFNLSDYKVIIESFEDSSDELGKTSLGGIKGIFSDDLERLKGSKGTLKADFNVYEVQKFSPGKAWIPFAGGHQMQAGVGVEILFKDKGGEVIAKIRHFARNGTTNETAAQEVASNIKKYISRN